DLLGLVTEDQCWPETSTSPQAIVATEPRVIISIMTCICLSRFPLRQISDDRHHPGISCRLQTDPDGLEPWTCRKLTWTKPADSDCSLSLQLGQLTRCF
ncbi:mCG144884, partial [Mus musculus]